VVFCLLFFCGTKRSDLISSADKKKSKIELLLFEIQIAPISFLQQDLDENIKN